jgi:putative tricarboxylic transport membrane protein
VLLLILNIPLVPLFAQILRLPYYVLYPLILGISIVGVYSVNNSLFDVWVMGLFGLLGYLMRKLDFPAAALILGMVLGDSLERALRQSLMMSQGDLTILIARPISGTLLFITAAILLLPALRKVRSWRIEAIEREA